MRAATFILALIVLILVLAAALGWISPPGSGFAAGVVAQPVSPPHVGVTGLEASACPFASGGGRSCQGQMSSPDVLATTWAGIADRARRDMVAAGVPRHPPPAYGSPLDQIPPVRTDACQAEGVYLEDPTGQHNAILAAEAGRQDDALRRAILANTGGVLDAEGSPDLNGVLDARPPLPNLAYPPGMPFSSSSPNTEWPEGVRQDDLPNWTPEIAGVLEARARGEVETSERGADAGVVGAIAPQLGARAARVIDDRRSFGEGRLACRDAGRLACRDDPLGCSCRKNGAYQWADDGTVGPYAWKTGGDPYGMDDGVPRNRTFPSRPELTYRLRAGWALDDWDPVTRAPRVADTARASLSQPDHCAPEAYNSGIDGV
jgi:hypothetical protein